MGIQRYSAEQVHAWAPPDRDSSTWVARITRLEPFVAELDGEVVGFMTLESDGHIDLAYTHANHQRRGIAGALYAHLEREARERKIRRLYVEASHLARPFFEQRGFEVLRKNDNVRGDQILVNWRMEKLLD